MRRVNINPTAFVTLGGLGPGGGSPLPVQFKFRIALECPPIALMDPELVVALGGGNAMGAIAAKETRAIANLFAKRLTHNFRCYDILHVISSFKDLFFLSTITLSHFSPPYNNRSPAFSASKLSSGSAANKPAGALGGTSGSTSYKAPFKFNADVPIDLVGSLYDIKKKLLGTNASTIIQLVDEVGSKNCVRVRMRGIGSGFLEGQQELQVCLVIHILSLPRSLTPPEELLSLCITIFHIRYSTYDMDIPGAVDVQRECRQRSIVADCYC